MSTELAESRNNAGLTVRPGVNLGAVAEQHRAIAEVQAALTVAAARPRDEQRAVERIATACQRASLAELAEYSYSRGGTEITGPTIDLLTCIANCWGNIQFGFRELSQTNGESTVEAFAWDLETNSKRSVVFQVPHVRVTNKGTTRTALTDPRDVYELVANYAQRRVRACLEAIVPVDVVEEAVNQCRETLKAKTPVTPETIKKLVDAFLPLGVTAEHISLRLSRRLDTMTPAQYLQMRRIWKSLKDGMSRVGDWFKDDPKQTDDSTNKPETGNAGLKGKLRGQKSTPEAAQDDEGEIHDQDSQNGQDAQEGQGEAKESTPGDSTGDPSDAEKAAIAAEEFADQVKERYAADWQMVVDARAESQLNKLAGAIEKQPDMTLAEKMVAQKWIAERRKQIRGKN